MLIFNQIMEYDTINRIKMTLKFKKKKIVLDLPDIEKQPNTSTSETA